jgi:quercetin dioxygenase-like cupin family protein
MKRVLSHLFVAVVVLVGTVAVMRSQQNTKSQFILQFENDDVLVWRSVISPGVPVPMHRHDHPRIIIPLRGGTMKIIEQSGAVDEHIWETGKAYWLPTNPPNTQHSDVNAGEQPIEVMVVQLQKEK